tara:strand:+ start:241 stop:1233 length:993 start_codon:yes stop_codon:yes gene_type:complete
MTADRFMLDGYRDEQLYTELAASNAFPLVRELEFKYGLKVLDAKGGGWLMCNKNGFAVGIAKFADERFTDGAEYCFYTPWYRKGRGRDGDVNTLHSKKLASLVAAIKRNKVLDEQEIIRREVFNCAGVIFERHSGKLGKVDKQHDLSAEEIHALVASHLGANWFAPALKDAPRPLRSGGDVDFKTFQVKCQNLLDKFNESDRILEEKRLEVARVYSSPYYMVGVDRRGDFIVGKVKSLVGENPWDKNSAQLKEHEVVQGFKRYKTITEVEDGKLIPIMTMIKLSYEGSELYGNGKYIPCESTYNLDLDVGFEYNNRPDTYNCTWALIPCI